MTATLFNHAALAHIEQGIEDNRAEAGGLVPAVLGGDRDAGERMNLLNVQWGLLEEARAEITGEPFCPYIMKRA